MTNGDRQQQCDELIQALRENTNRGTELNRLGDECRQAGDLNRAAEWYEESLRLAITPADVHLQPDQYAEGVALFRLGTLYYVKGRYERAREYLQKSAQSLGHDARSRAVAYLALATTHEQQAAYYDALNCYQCSLESLGNLDHHLAGHITAKRSDLLRRLVGRAGAPHTAEGTPDEERGQPPQPAERIPEAAAGQPPQPAPQAPETSGGQLPETPETSPAVEGSSAAAASPVVEPTAPAETPSPTEATAPAEEPAWIAVPPPFEEAPPRASRCSQRRWRNTTKSKDEWKPTPGVMSEVAVIHFWEGLLEVAFDGSAHDVLSTMQASEVLTEQDKVRPQLQGAVDAKMQGWGLRVHNLSLIELTGRESRRAA